MAVYCCCNLLADGRLPVQLYKAKGQAGDAHQAVLVR